MCKSGLDFLWADGQNCQNRPINGDQMAWGVYGDFSKNIKTNSYDSTTKAVEWSQLSDGIANCPPKNLQKVKLNLATPIVKIIFVVWVVAIHLVYMQILATKTVLMNIYMLNSIYVNFNIL